MKYSNIREEELKNKIAQDYFGVYDCTKVIGNVDFCVSMYRREFINSEHESLLWAEAKRGSSDIHTSIVQLILTIGKARTFDNYLPPPFLGAFDSEKIVFIPYNQVHEIFYQNDFNWNVTPSNHETKEFNTVLQRVTSVLDANTLLFDYHRDEKELKRFIKKNFVIGKFGLTRTKIDKNNFMVIYNKWFQTVKPTIRVRWDIAKKVGIIDGDFYLADLLSQENRTLKEKLHVLLRQDYYEFDRNLDEIGIFSSKRTDFTDKQVAHTQFWNKYKRPPEEQYWDYIVERRDLLVPQDIRERKGSFFTPQIWVELSQRYLADVLGKDWQDEYYIWDCAAGTGNLLNGLTNKYNIWASTLDKQDVEVMQDRIQNGANLLDSHVFQFDFLNDDFEKLPKSLYDIIQDPEKRKKLVIYINPPYAEATDGIGQGGSKIDVSKETKMYSTYGPILGRAKNELFAQFFIRIYKELNGCLLATFSKLKHLQSPAFAAFRKEFKASVQKMFIVPAYTFDNVAGNFPIGFGIWNTQERVIFREVKVDVFNEKGSFLLQKEVFAQNGKGYINQWIKSYADTYDKYVGYLVYSANDFQHSAEVRFSGFIPSSHVSTLGVDCENVFSACVYLSVRHCIKATWLNDRDQFLYPNDGWETDTEFQNDCLAFALFHGQNRISSKDGTNHWIPFTEQEVEAREKFESNFMVQFLKGKIKPERKGIDIFSVVLEPAAVYVTPLRFSQTALDVFHTGRELWRYYHRQPKCNVNASLYDIREHFQGRNAKGQMNSKSDDSTYTELITSLRNKLKLLATKITPMVYEYGFLRN